MVQDVRLLRPMRESMLGDAFTVRYVSAPEDLKRLEAIRGRARPQCKAVEECPPGTVMVFDSREDARAICCRSTSAVRQVAAERSPPRERQEQEGLALPINR